MTRKQKADERRLLESIEHWKRMRKAEIVGKPKERPDASQCGLCQSYLHKDGWCGRCPIHKHTRKRGCEGTPYHDAAHWFWRCAAHARTRTEGAEPIIELVEWKLAATREIRFLQRVLAKVRAGKL